MSAERDNPRTTQIYDRSRDEVTIEAVERIRF